MKKLLSILMVLVMVFAFTACGGNGEEVEIENPINLKMEVSILVEDAAEDGFESFTEEFLAEEGSNLLDATQLYCVANDKTISINEDMGYVTELLGLSEKDYSETTGWLFYINGESPSVGASEIEVKDGDVIKWEFVDYSTLSW